MAGLAGLGSITAFPAAHMAGVSGRASPTINQQTFWNAQQQGMGAPPLAPQAYVTTSMGTQAPPIGITTYTPPGWTWGKVAVGGIVVAAVFYGAYRAANWWDRR
jgi:hypothetical protein